MEARAHLHDTLEELRALERQAEREWWWLHGTLNAVAQMRAERAGGSPMSFREMQEQARKLDRRRVEIAVRIAELQGSCRGRSSGTSKRCACNQWRPAVPSTPYHF